MRKTDAGESLSALLPQGARTAILVVEDEPVLARQLCAGLAASDLGAEFVTSAEAARERLASDPAIRVVITDLHLPGESGLDLLSHLRKETADRPVELILITGDRGAEEEARQLGAALLHKPFRLGAAVQVVQDALARLDARRAGQLPTNHAGRG